MPFLTISRGGVLEQRVTLDKDVIRIGRLDDNDVALKDGSISRHHARIERQGDRIVIKDLGSQNGIWSGGARVSELELTPGTAFVMGIFSGLVEAPAIETAPPAAAAYTWAKLFVLDGPVAQPEFSLNRPELRFGRSAGVEVPINDDLVSKNHARIVYQNNQHTIMDTGSRNGVFVNGLRVESQTLKHRDEIQIGPARFAYSETGEFIPPQPVMVSAIPAAGMGAPPSAGHPRTPAMGAAAKQKSLFSRVPRIVWFGGLLALVIVIILMAVLSGPPKTAGPSSKEISAENQQTIQKLLLEGKQFLAGGDYQSALDKANAVLTPDLDPKNREALELQAKAQDKLRELAAAREKAQQEAAERASKIQTLLTDSAAASKRGDFAAAKSLLEDARTLDPENANVKKALVETLITSAQADSRKRDYKGAFEAYDAALQLDPMNAEAKKGRESLANYEQAAKARETRTRTLFEQARSEAASGALAKAYQDINSVLSLNPSYPQAANLRSQIQSQLEAKVKPLYDEGVRLFNAGQLVEAASKLSQALAIYPDHQPTQQFLMQARSKLRAEAQEAFRRGYINEGLGRYKEAMDLYQRTLNLLPDPNEEYHKKAADKIAQLKDKVR